MSMTSKLDLKNPLGFNNEHNNLFKINKFRQDDQGEFDVTLDFMLRVAVYVLVMAIIGMMVALLAKLLGICNSYERTGDGEITATETDRLMPKVATPITYGTCEEDVESGNCSSSSSSDSLEDLFNEKICVVCYDRERNCFLVPCGHCATCYVCAKRIFEGDNKTCPVCRRLIGKVRKWFTS